MATQKQVSGEAMRTWDREEQVKKSQKAIEHLNSRREKEKEMTEKEIEDSKKEFQLLEEIIKKHH